MPSADERRDDIPESEATTPGEQRVIRYTVREKQDDGTFANAADFGDYSGWTFYLMPNLLAGGASAAARGSVAYASLGTASMDIATPPYVDVTIPGSVTALAAVGRRAHELWAVVNGGTVRLSYGNFPFVA